MSSSDMTSSSLTTKQQIESLWKLGGLTIPQLAKRVWKAAMESDLLGLASQLAYNFLLAVFPMLLFLVALFGVFASQSVNLRQNLFYYFAQVLPPAAYQLVSKTLEEVTRNSGGGKLTFGILLALWASAGGMSSLMSALNGAYHVRESRPWWKVRGTAILLTIAISVLVVAALLMILAGSTVAEFVGSKLHLSSYFVLAWKIAQWPLALIFIVVSFALIYYFGSDLKEQHWYWITPGALVGVVLWVLFSLGFRVYLHFFNSYSKSYGSLGAVIILLLWFYVTGISFLAGGVINSEIEHAAAQRGHPEAKAPGEKESPAQKAA